MADSPTRSGGVYEYLRPVIKAASFSVNPADMNAKTVLSVTVTEELVILEPVWYYSGEVQAGEAGFFGG